ncbi:hypothetical protein Tco_0536008 [Tanacetum coccineum]
MEEAVNTWLIRSYKKQFEEYIEIKRQLEVYGLYTDVECDPTNIDFAEWLASKYSNYRTMDWYMKNVLWIYWVRGDDEEIDVDVLTGDLPGFKTYEEYKDTWIYKWNKEVPWVEEKPWLEDRIWKDPINDIHHGKKEGEESSDDAWSHYSPIDEWEDYEHTTYIETDVNSNQNTYNNVCQIFKNHAGMTNDDAIQSDQEWFDERKPMEDNDHIGDSDDYLITSDASYYVNEEEEKFNEKTSKLLGIPYKRPPTFRSEKFKVIKYSFGQVEEYVGIKEHEYEIWLRTKENVSQVYEEIFRKKDEGWSMTRMK